MKRLIFLILITPIAIGSECVNESRASCNVYEMCFAKKCNCAGEPDEYLLSFGRRYCEAFLGRSDFSEQGLRWRDKTLRCLQERVIEVVPLDGEGCNCKSLKGYALSTHVDCYASQPESVCDLPLSDVVNIGKTILLDRAVFGVIKDSNVAIKQVLGGFSMCSNEARTPEAREAWSNFYRFGSSIITPQPPSQRFGVASGNFQDASTKSEAIILSDLPPRPTGLTWDATNTNRSLKMDIMRAFSLGSLKFGNGFFDLGGGVLVKALTGTSLSKIANRFGSGSGWLWQGFEWSPWHANAKRRP